MYILKTKSSQLPFYFPLSITYSHAMPPTSPHAHDCNEIGIILEGIGIHESLGERKEISVGDVIIIYPNQFHSFPETQKLNMFNVLFEPGKINIPMPDLEKIVGFNHFFAQNDEKNNPFTFPFFHLNETEFKHVRKIIGLMRTEQKNIGHSGYRSAMLGLFMNLLCHLLRSYSAGLEFSSKSDCEKNIDNVVKYLNHHYLESFVLKSLLKISAMSRSSFMVHFKTITGYSPKQYVIRKRIAHAVRRIAECKVPLTEIAMECGFHDSSHFCKAFKNITNESPRSYRQRISERSDLESLWSQHDTENPFTQEIIE